MTSRLHQLMKAHDMALAAFDAREDNYDKDNDTTGLVLDAAREAILSHRPTLAEIPAKAAFMLRNRTFTEWDYFDQRRLIEALNPADGLVDTARKPSNRRLLMKIEAYVVGLILLASIVGMAICAVWIAITWRVSG